MPRTQSSSPPHVRESPAELTPAQFREIGHRLVDQIAGFLATIDERPVVPPVSPRELRALLGGDGVPQRGMNPGTIIDEAAELMFSNSTLNGHPRFFGYITSSAAPIGALADLLASAVNANCGAWALSPMATEIERQTVRWIAELIGYSPSAGGLLVSGGNVANMVCLIAALRAKAGWDVRARGVADAQRIRVYASSEVHTWLQKGADICGLGTDSFCPIAIDHTGAMSVTALRRAIADDRAKGLRPAVVVGTAGSVGTGAIDALGELSELCAAESLWFHIDGAYGAPAAMLSDAPAELHAIGLGDSVAVDPHKWLYAPLEAGCALVRNSKLLHDTFVFHPPYFEFDGSVEDPPTNYHEWGPQNSRGFRALKVWATIRQVGREGYVRMIGDDIELAQELHRLASQSEELEALTQSLSITTFRYVPRDLRNDAGAAEYLNTLNKALLQRLQDEGRVYVSNAVLGNVYALRACIVNFRTGKSDVQALVDATVEGGRALDRELR